MKKRFLAGIGTLVGSVKLAAQQANTDLSSLNNALVGEYTKIKDIAGTILLILLVIAFIFMIVNFIFNVTEQKKSIIGFLVTVLLYGLFKIIF